MTTAWIFAAVGGFGLGCVLLGIAIGRWLTASVVEMCPGCQRHHEHTCEPLAAMEAPQ